MCMPPRTLAILIFSSSSSAVTVQGSLFNGMSTAVVTPPTAMAAVAVSMPAVRHAQGGWVGGWGGSEVACHRARSHAFWHGALCTVPACKAAARAHTRCSCVACRQQVRQASSTFPEITCTHKIRQSVGLEGRLLTLPVSAPGLIHVHMHIHHAWTDDRIFVVQHRQFIPAWHLGLDVYDLAVADGDCKGRICMLGGGGLTRGCGSLSGTGNGAARGRGRQHAAAAAAR